MKSRQKWVSLEEFVSGHRRKRNFRNAYTEELGRLQLAYQIRTLRQKKGLTQQKVAHAARMPQSVVARIESGSRGFSIATLNKIARVFDREIALVSPRARGGS